ncbi:LytR/AlgR family response regulator transcription factor [Chitinophaga rhizophila]|uniref:LytTR family DNA-binding domain-containing protein n=1 Tax=Chitinophaga rhizophila TaxID=2866212 RepID=A0ABS7GDE6_9BACT|nr:LytTR family DNA-binding domain-containing protein [Chitinophaga rhizophila]MBW8685687.1 LytTR family DNA-binding domain-containing protein [Chitinophaga rhizophila]
MLSILIIEDELPNAARLKKLLLQIDRNIEIVGDIQTVEGAIAWLQANNHPDIICMDIKLTDGLSFEIFDHVEVRSHVIFITAYDEYALKAFEVNGIDYLLKPLDETQLEKSITRIKTLVNKASNTDLLEVIRKMQQREDVYRTRFLVSYRDMFIPVMVNNIAYFFSEHKLVYLVTNQGDRYAIDQTLEELEQELNPREFFRATRQYIVSAVAIRKIHQTFNGKLKLDLYPPAEEVVVSREKSVALRKWLS